ncbi:hypothetical protein ONE63_000620 [Megalurothrips usitatus]|uniref:Synaptic plasticity regulator PANTS n=1 Tax=Megalurothrips usitatus TaxID=439358 RepID=A0AAV7Y2X3_9NEOP|nr:hypothetical protein ONE63_000620 [Megalurothrips usitatus]
MANGQSQPNQGVKNGETQDEALATHLIRPCERYQDEYEQCRSSKGRRQQIFVYGNVLDCEPWAKDFANCQKWTWTSDAEAAGAVVKNERERLKERLTPHLSTKVWEKRETPPENWNAPLPSFQEFTKNSYLTRVSKEGDYMKEASACAIQ